MVVITISREAGSGGDEVARRVCELLDYRYFDKGLMARVAQEVGISETELVDFSEDSYRGQGFIDALLRRSAPIATTIVRTTTAHGEDAFTLQDLDEATAADFVAGTIWALRKHGRVVVVGRGGQAILRDQPGVLHVRLIARHAVRVAWMMQSVNLTRDGVGLTREAAVERIAERDRATARYLRRFYSVDWMDSTLYHLTLNTSLLGQEETAQLIVAAAQRLAARGASQPPPSAGGAPPEEPEVVE
jgi:cytidylate kinase